MMFLTITVCLFTCVYDSSAVDIMSKLKRNILNFVYGVNFKYEGMLSHSFDRFYVVTKYEIPNVSDLKLTMIEFDLTCSHLNSDRKYMTKLKKHCFRIAPYISFYQRQIIYYTLTAHRILTEDIGLILPNFPTNKRNKQGAIIASVLGGIASSVIGLAYEGISSFLHQKRHKALNKAVTVIEKKTDLQKKTKYII